MASSRDPQPALAAEALREAGVAAVVGSWADAVELLC